MKKLTPSFIAIAITCTLYNNASYAINLPKAESSNPQCLIDVPRFDRPLVDGDINTLPVEAESNQFEAFYPNTAIYQGDVFIEQGNRTVKADKVTIDTQDKNHRTAKLEGNITYQDNLIKMKGKNALINLNNNDTNMTPSEYHLVNRLGRGDADEMKLENNRYVILKNGSYTSCPVNDSTWNIKGTTVIHDREEQLLEVWNAVFRIGKVPVLYSPYLQLPTGDKRRSGLLMPNFSYDSVDGIDFSLPIYWNIAPNYDATFTPRVLQQRGVQLQTEFRYLNEIGLGTLAFDWLQHDAQYGEDRDQKLNGNNYDDNQHRWLFHWDNAQLINYNWRFYANTTRVSDNQYLNDLDSQYASETDGYLTQFYQAGYNDENWDVTLGYRHFQPLYAEGKDNLYQTQPQLDIHYYNYDLGPLKFKTFSQISHFITSGNKKPRAWRSHIEPTINYTLSNSWASLATEAGLMATHYNQDNIKKYNESVKGKDKDKLDRNVNRFMPKFSIDGKVVFERDMPIIEGYTQTLEPRVKYTYIPYRNQSNIGSYDSTLLQFDYIGLFRDQPYSGLDRIASTNNLAAGVTTRLYDDNKIEKFNFSIGQITYFTKSKTSEHNNDLDKNSDTGSITWATDSFWRVTDDFIFRSGIQYDTRINTISLANTIFEYRPTSEKLIQLSYRYANHNYIDTIRHENIYQYKQDISQAGIMTTWPLSQTVNAVGSYYYDIKLGQTADGFVGLHYSDCCWGMTVQYGRKLTDWDSHQSKYENKLSVNFELQGLGRTSDAKAKMLNFGKLPYTTIFE